MEPRRLMIVLCIIVITVSKHSKALPAQNERIIFRDDLQNLAVPSISPGAPNLLAPIKITEMRVRSEIALRYACTSVITYVKNPGTRPQEATLRMLLPDTAFITNFTMFLGGKSYKAYVKEREEASRIYSEAVSQGASAAHIATEARDSNHFTVSVNVEGNTTAIFDLRYEEFLVRRNGLYNHAINLHPGALVPKMEVVVHIKESQKITKLFVPEVRTGNEIDATERDAQNSKAVIRYGISKREVTVSFAPDLLEQERLAEVYELKSKRKDSVEKYIGYSSDEEEEVNKGVLGQFVVQYDVQQSNKGEILVNDGYFVHFLAPTSLPPLSKHVVFVLDTSGSMMGRKIEQLRNAMDAILSDLNPNDYFNIVEFNSDVTVHELKEADDVQSDWKSHATLVPPSRASPENINKAKVIVSELDVSGVTNIFNALDVAINLVRQDVPERKRIRIDSWERGYQGNCHKQELERMIIFLTDGDANEGETSIARITTSITKKNSGAKRAALYSLAFGEEANRIFLRELSLRNEGFMRHIYEAADAALQLQDFYRQVSSPLLSHVQFLYPRRQIKEGSVSRNLFRTINSGAEVAVVGQIAENVTEITPTVRGLRSSDNGLGRTRYETTSKVVVNRTTGEYLPLERLWAYLTINQLLDKRDAGNYYSTDENSPEERALSIALTYAFVTPVTSLVIVKPIANHSDVHEVLSTSSRTPRTSNWPVMRPIVPQAMTQSDLENQPTGRFLDGKSFKPMIKSGYTALSDSSNPTGAVVLISSTRLHRPESWNSYNRHRDRLNQLGRWNFGNHNHQYGRPGKESEAVYETTTDYHVYGRHVEDGNLLESIVPNPVVKIHRSKSQGEVLQENELNEYRPSKIQGKILQEIEPKEYRPIEIEDDDTVATFVLSPDFNTYRSKNEESTDPNYEVDSNENLENAIYAFARIESAGKSNESFVVLRTNETQITLKLSTDDNTPKSHGGDEECTNSIAMDENGNTGGLCVYISRCYDFRSISAEDYLNSYCVVDNSYAGICCPRNHVDVIF
ncbi:inter-alpha-trypsin inhibitor heavy chain H3-like [Pararge aegeria]|uniref:inter-alpha-trypsin inhibitor heavy chain H3-like n=1 Tax=Pararge aegeria TaxID=116150 RepID=UPI0019CF521E|nr:inter-alpha-trypsin inhibitor heavy chain H3-like [Pararge aegeria]